MSGVSSTQSPQIGRASSSDSWQDVSAGAGSPTAPTNTSHVEQAAAIVFEAKRTAYWNAICEVWQAVGFLKYKTDGSWSRIKTAALHPSCELLTQPDVDTIVDDMLLLAKNAEPKLRPFLLKAACELAHSSKQIRDAETLQEEADATIRLPELPYDAHSEQDQIKLKQLAKQILGPGKCGKLENRRIYVQDLLILQKTLTQQADSDERTQLERMLQEYIDGCNKASIEDDMFIPPTRRISQERVSFTDRWTKCDPIHLESVPSAHDDSYYNPAALFAEVQSCFLRHEAVLKGEQCPLQTRLNNYETALRELTHKLTSEIDKIRSNQARIKRLQEDRAKLDQETATANATKQQSAAAVENCHKVSALTEEFTTLNKEIHALGLKHQEAERAKAQLEEEIASLEACKPDQVIRRAQEALPGLLLPFTLLSQNIGEASSSAIDSTDAANEKVKRLQIEAYKLSSLMNTLVHKAENEKKSIEAISKRYHDALLPFDQTVARLLQAQTQVRATYNTIQDTLTSYSNDLEGLKTRPAEVASRNAIHQKQMQTLESKKSEQEAAIATLIAEASKHSAHAESILDALEEVQSSYAQHLREMEGLQKSFAEFEEAVFPKTDWDRYVEKINSLAQNSSDTLGPILSQTGQFLSNVASAAYNAPWAAAANSVATTLHGWASWIVNKL